MMSDPQLEEAARLFGILSDPSRLRLLRALMTRPLTVSELIEETGMRQGNVSKHLGVLLSSRFVAREREGNFARYSLSDPKLYQLCDLMCTRIAEDARQRIKELTR
ncbi:MAG: metalloregulator ArsR/SmtB family transcription factor [Terrimicrobiaceae bacterium]